MPEQYKNTTDVTNLTLLTIKKHISERAPKKVAFPVISMTESDYEYGDYGDYDVDYDYDPDEQGLDFLKLMGYAEDEATFFEVQILGFWRLVPPYTSF